MQNEWRSTGPFLLISKTAIKQKQIASLVSFPHLPTQCRKVFTLETLSGAFTEKRWKAFENMKDDYGNNSINESVCSIAKLFCDLLLFGDILTATRRQNSGPPLFFHEILFYLLLLYQHVAGLQIKWKKSSHGPFFKVSLAGNRHLLFPF